MRATKFGILPRTNLTQSSIQLFCSSKVAVDVCLKVVGDVIGDDRDNLTRVSKHIKHNI